MSSNRFHQKYIKEKLPDLNIKDFLVGKDRFLKKPLGRRPSSWERHCKAIPASTLSITSCSCDVNLAGIGEGGGAEAEEEALALVWQPLTPEAEEALPREG
jgi:hypothetical protein